MSALCVRSRRAINCGPKNFWQMFAGTVSEEVARAFVGGVRLGDALLAQINVHQFMLPNLTEGVFLTSGRSHPVGEG